MMLFSGNVLCSKTLAVSQLFKAAKTFLSKTEQKIGGINILNFHFVSNALLGVLTNFKYPVDFFLVAEWFDVV